MAAWNDYGCSVSVISLGIVFLSGSRCGWLSAKINTTVFNRDLGTL